MKSKKQIKEKNTGQYMKDKRKINGKEFKNLFSSFYSYNWRN